MARLRTFGGEWNSAAADFGQASTTTLTVQSSVVRTGTYAFSLAPDGSTAAGVRVAFTASTGRHYYYRAYVRFTANPARDFRLFGWSEGSSTLITAVNLNTSGQFVLVNNVGGGVGSAYSASPNTWYRVELDTFVPSSAGVTTVAMRVDGSSIASGNITRTNNAPAEMYFGDVSSAATLSATVYMDDIAINDDTGSFQNSWPGDGKVLLSVPTADAQRGSWTGGVGGTTNLFDAINNKPPTGTASETDSTQIENTDSTGDNSTDEYQGTMQTYTAAGLGGSDVLKVAQAMLWHGEDVATGTKTGSISLLSNPASGAYTAFTYGDNVGALGTWPTNWRLAWQTGIDASGATAGTAPVVALRKTDANATVGSVCAVGIYFEFTTPTNTTVTPGVASLTTTAYAPTVGITANVTVTAGLATLTLTPLTPTVSTTANVTATPGVASLALTPLTPTVTATDNKVVTPDLATLALSPQTPVVTATQNQLAIPNTATLTTTALAPVVTATDNKTAVPGLATLSLTALTPVVSATDNKTVVVGTASLTATPLSPTVTATDSKTVTPGVASLTLTPLAPSVSTPVTVTPGTASLSLTAFAPDTVLSDQKVVTPGPAALAITAFAPVVDARADWVVTPGTATLTITASEPRVRVSELSKLSKVMNGLAAALEAQGYRQVYAYPAESVTVPCAIVDYPSSIDFDVVFQRGADRFHMVVRYIVGGYNAATAAAIGSALFGPDSLQRIDGGYAWGQARVARATVEGIQVGGIDYVQGRFEVEVIA